ncbi:MAG TPA: hypothetical protein VFZ53_12225 [Polyangiaceae bacterium]
MRFGKNVAYFALGFLMFELVRRALVPPVPGPIERELATVLAQRSSCTVLAVGPSYVKSQIVPDAFDREADRIGLRERVCKYGASSLRGYELRKVLERLLEHDWPRLRLVLIDITLGDGIDFEPDNWLNPRLVEWHTLQSMPWLLAYYEREPMPLGDKLPRLVSHAKHFLAHYAEVGHGIEWLGSLELLERFRPRSEPIAPGEAERAERRRRGARYDRQVRKLIERRSKRERNAADSGWALELRSLVRAHDKEAYFVVAPVLYSARVPKRARRGRDRLVVFDFNDPERYPELYEERVRGTTSHLNRRGSILYTELLARELEEHERRRR